MNNGGTFELIPNRAPYAWALSTRPWTVSEVDTSCVDSTLAPFLTFLSLIAWSKCTPLTDGKVFEAKIY